MGFWDVINPFKTNFEWVTEYDSLRLYYSSVVRRRALSYYPTQTSELDSLAQGIDAKLKDCDRSSSTYFFCDVDRISMDAFKSKLKELGSKVLNTDELKLIDMPSPTTEAAKAGAQTVVDIAKFPMSKQLVVAGVIILFAVLLMRD